ncbi:hypothetical protein Misp02_29700 [Microtetraspora sp. NBRC 16547]|nr:hypothetical protein Misp02_29700 [Microtetraspora sp. NBRC 16547]
MCDTAISGWETVLHLRVRRFRCGNDAWGTKTFAEQVPGLTVQHSRFLRGRNCCGTTSLR